MDIKIQKEGGEAPVAKRRPKPFFQIALLILVWIPLCVWLYSQDEMMAPVKVAPVMKDGKVVTPGFTKDAVTVPLVSWLRVIFTLYAVNTII